jgi:hypothetical protein
MPGSNKAAENYSDYMPMSSRFLSQRLWRNFRIVKTLTTYTKYGMGLHRLAPIKYL